MISSWERKEAAVKDLESFLEERKLGIGGSDIHHLFNLEPWGCERRLAYDKRQIPADQPQEETLAMKRGTALEDVAAQEYMERTGRTVRRMPFRQHKDDPWLIVHADRSIHSKHSRELTGEDLGPGVLELKVPASWAFQKLRMEGIPDAYQLQLQHGMLVTGRKWGSFGVLWADGWQMAHWDVLRDDDICHTIQGQAEYFWQSQVVDQGELPPRLDAQDSRCKGCPWQESCQDAYLAEIKAQTQEMEKDDTMADLVSDWIEAKQMESVAQGLVKARAALVREKMGDRKQVLVGRTKLSFVPQERKVIDSKRLEEERPDIYQEYLKTSWSRPLRSKEL